jgi:hypothetical protein
MLLSPGKDFGRRLQQAKTKKAAYVESGALPVKKRFSKEGVVLPPLFVDSDSDDPAVAAFAIRHSSNAMIGIKVKRRYMLIG